MLNANCRGWIIMLACAGVMATAGPAFGNTGNWSVQETLAAAYQPEQAVLGSDRAADVVADVVEAASDIQGDAAPWLLPPNTSVDSATWNDNLLLVDLTVPAITADYWHLSPIDQETIGEALGRPFIHDSAFAGVRVRIRTGRDQAYGSLEQFLLHPASDEAPAPPLENNPDLSIVTEQRGGPTTHAARQPQGALSGVTVYASAGHGWTANDTRWYLQRPVLLGMAEDYGNIDQLNYFVQYCFNAGATVVPLRPVGWQPIEIVLDNDDPGVTFSGDWVVGSGVKYYENNVTSSGTAYRWSTAVAEETSTARYTPTIAESDFYPVYCFTVAGTNRTLQTYRVKHSGGVTEIVIDHREVGNGWIWLGDYYLEAGGDNYVEISNESVEPGAIVADAIRWGCGIGDISRPGPNSISGYPRDEECQRYWAHSELGNNAVGFSSDIWDGGGDDAGDNVRTGGKVAREMNQVPSGGVLVDRWKRVHLEFHTNASGGAARGQICLITDLGETTYQSQYANTLSNEIDADLPLVDDEFEHAWVDRSSATYTSSYGAICTGANSDEFDATIVELAFHDNQQDAELLRDPRVRSAMARACTHGIIRFLNGLSGSQVPLAFAPDTPRYVRAVHIGDGDVRVSWLTPLADGARGDAADGYVVYQSSNGYGFGEPVIVGNELTTVISGLAEGETRYFRVAATNAGGESMPSEVLAVRRPAPTDEPELVLIVNGYDRLRRQITPIQTFTQPAAYAGDSIERAIWSGCNSYDYVVQHAEALAAAGYAFDSSSNEAVSYSYIVMDAYDVAVWILGQESTEDVALTTAEQNRIQSFLYDGKALFITGSDLGFNLIGGGAGASFMQDILQTGYVGDDSATYSVAGKTGSCLAAAGAFDFDPDLGAAYDVRTPDRLAVRPESGACLDYVGGNGGTAGVQYGNGLYNVIVFGFPFEAISSAADRETIMALAMGYLTSNHEPLAFNYDGDLDVDADDFLYFEWCFQGPDYDYPAGTMCVDVYGEEDLDIDLEDFSVMQNAITGPY